MEEYEGTIQARLLGISEVFPKKELQLPLATLVGFLLGAMCMMMLVQSNVIDLSAKQYVYVNVEKVISEINNDLIEQITSNKIDDKEVEDRLNKAKTRFDNLLENYISKHNAVVFSSNKVISGAKDITDYFISNLKGKE